VILHRAPTPTLFPYTTLFRSKYRDLMDTEHIYAFIVVDHRHRAYHPLRGGDIARYDPASGKVERLKQTIDCKAPSADSHLADARSEEHTSELQSRSDLVCRLL